VRIREATRLIENGGWYLTRTKGSHRQYRHPVKKGLVTISGKLSDDVGKGTLSSILKQAGLKGAGRYV
jgi:predicted RNA binding protein YcfA (HicA-like mRNA interferase family)